MAANFKDTDALVVNRGADNYKATYADLKESLGSDGIGAIEGSDLAPDNPQVGDIWLDTGECPPELKVWSDCSGTGQWEGISGGGGDIADPIVNNVYLDGNDTGGNRFSGTEFTATVTMVNEGTPTAQKSYNYSVFSDFLGVAETSAVTSSLQDQYVEFAESTNLDQFQAGDEFIAKLNNHPQEGIKTGNLKLANNTTENKTWPNQGIISQPRYSCTYQWPKNLDDPTNLEQVTHLSCSTNTSTKAFQRFTEDAITYQEVKWEEVFSSGGNSYPFQISNFFYDLYTKKGILCGSSQQVGRVLHSSDYRNFGYIGNVILPGDNSGVSDAKAPFNIGETIYQIGANYIYTSTNFGNSWTRSNSPIKDNLKRVDKAISFGPKIRLYGVDPNNNYKAFEIDCATFNSASAASYKQITYPFNYFLQYSFGMYKYPSAEGGIMWMMHANNAIYYSIDYGKTWPQLNMNFVDSSKLSRVAWYDQSTHTCYSSSKHTSYDHGSIWGCPDIEKEEWFCMMSIGKNGTRAGTKGGVSAGKNHGFFIHNGTDGSGDIYRYNNVDCGGMYGELTVDSNNLNAQQELDSFPTGCFVDVYYNDLFRQRMKVSGRKGSNLELTSGFDNNLGQMGTNGTINLAYSSVQPWVAFNYSSGSTAYINATPFNSDLGAYDYYSSTEKLLANASRFLVVNANGEVTGFANGATDNRLSFLNSDTITFPQNAPTGSSWDTELPAGTRMMVSLYADNTLGGGGRSPSSGYYTATYTPGLTYRNTAEGVQKQELLYETFDYRTDVYRQQLVDRGEELKIQLVEEGYTKEQINEVMNGTGTTK